jgi:hypothetical protein
MQVLPRTHCNPRLKITRYIPPTYTGEVHELSRLKVTLLWTPDHVGISGIEEAHAAKDVTLQNTYHLSIQI